MSMFLCLPQSIKQRMYLGGTNTMENNNYTFTGTMAATDDAKAVKAKKRKKRVFAALGAIAATAGAAYLYHKGFSNGADAMQSAAQHKLNDAFTAGVIGGYSRAGIDFGELAKDDAPNLVNTLVSEMTTSGFLSEGALTNEEVDRLIEAAIGTP